MIRAALPLQVDPDPFEAINDLLGSPYLRLAGYLVAAFFVVLWLALAYWAFSDAGRRGASRLFWGFVALVFPFAGALIYLLVRPPEYALDHRERELELAVLEKELRNRVDSCPNCRSPIEKDYLLCPACGWDLKVPCESCARPISLDWATCPYCATVQKGQKNVDW